MHRFLLTALLAIITSCSDKIKVKQDVISKPQSISIPKAENFSSGDSFDIDTTVKSDFNRSSTGMSGEVTEKKILETKTIWSTKILTRFSKFEIVDYALKHTVKEGSGDSQEIVPPREIILLFFDHNGNPAHIDAINTADDKFSKYVFYRNLSNLIKNILGGSTFTAGKKIELSEGLVLAFSSFFFTRQETLAGFSALLQTENKSPEIQYNFSFAGTQDTVAIFEFESKIKAKLLLGNIMLSCKGHFGIKSGKLYSVDIESKYNLNEVQFYETVAANESVHFSMVIKPYIAPVSSEAVEISAPMYPGEKYRVTRSYNIGSRASKDLSKTIEFIQEYKKTGDSITTKRRYLQVPDPLAAMYLGIDATTSNLDGKELTIDLGKGDGKTWSSKDTDPLFQILGQDETLRTWLPSKPVKIGDFWTRTGSSAVETLKEDSAFAFLSTVSQSNTGDQTAYILVINPPHFPLEGNRTKTISAFICVSLNEKKIKSIFSTDFQNNQSTWQTDYNPVPVIDWKEPTAKQKLSNEFKNKLKAADTHFVNGKIEDSLKEVRQLLIDGLLELEKSVEQEIDVWVKRSAENDDAELARFLAVKLNGIRTTDKRALAILEVDYKGGLWKKLGEDAENFTRLYVTFYQGYLYRAIAKMKNREFKSSDYKEALELLKTALSKIDERDPEANTGKARISYWSAKANLNLGNFKQAHELLESTLSLVTKGPDRKEIVGLLSEVMEAEKLKIYISFNAPEYLPLGMYHLMSERGGPMHPFIDLHIINGSESDMIITFSSEVVDVTYTSIDQVLLPARKQKDGSTIEAPFNMRIYQTPPIRKDFDANKIVEEIERPIKITLKEKTDTGDKILLERTIPVKLWPRKRHVWQKIDKELTGELVYSDKAIAAWVTPRSPFIEKFITDAKKLLPKGVEFYGGFGSYPPKEQIRAFYNYLKSLGTSYVGHTTRVDKDFLYQDIRLPYEVYQTANCLCVEGSVLFASLMEAINLKPVLINVPGHTIVGWHDKNGPVQYKGSRLYVLETTSIGRHNFDQALEFAEKQFNSYRQLIENSARWDSYLYDIVKLRAEGYKPQPFVE